MSTVLALLGCSLPSSEVRPSSLPTSSHDCTPHCVPVELQSGGICHHWSLDEPAFPGICYWGLDLGIQQPIRLRFVADSPETLLPKPGAVVCIEASTARESNEEYPEFPDHLCGTPVLPNAELPHQPTW